MRLDRARGQAFLLTIALSAGNGQLARVSSSLLGAVAAYVSMQLMTRHRQAEHKDAHWLEQYEKDDFSTVIHGRTYSTERNASPIPRLFNVKGYEAWMFGFGAFGVVAVTTCILSVVCPDVF
ncbi:hypothetical protein DSM104299_03607 [Baekduia alba]|uniref:hypothetical protein n=1 Tax=Baekduia alba TaxID=2997333 RepID=UPI00233FB1A6|nr:hypothetical protein [Baekduia alba]WCB94867.1 hypothetical protein DSM104299_03607 [Baekduia alba]